MATSWLVLMGEDSNLSMASTIASLDANDSKSKFDPEFDNSQQGINLLLKQNVNFSKFLNSEDSQQSRKRKFKDIVCSNEDDMLPPKAKQRTNVNGEWKKRKKNENKIETKHETVNGTINFSHFLNCNKENKKPKENEENIIKTSPNPIQKTTRTRITPSRITPSLPQIVFSTDLIKLHKVPILEKKKDSNQISGPMFLNLDQFKQLNKNKTEKQTEKKEEIKEIKEIKEKEEKQEEKEEEKEEKKENEAKEDKEEKLSVWDKETEKEEGNKSWASKLFAQQISRNKILKEKEEQVLVKQKTEERMHDIGVESILPPSMTRNYKSLSIPSIPSSISSPRSTATSNTTVMSVIPSADATEWRDKQIKIGKDTIGYKNYIKKYPNKDLRYTLSHNLIPTPDSKEKIGKKRWVGKYNKWRKFLHQFDFDQ